MKSRLYIITGITIAFTITFFVLGPSQGHIAEYFLTEEQFEDLILNSDNSDRYLTYDKSLTITFSPLNLEDIELSFDWCTENNGFWNNDESTCYFKTQKDLDDGIMALDKYVKAVFGETIFGKKENVTRIVSFDDPIYDIPWKSESKYNNASSESESYQETKDHLPTINSKNKGINSEIEPKQESEMTFDYVIESNNVTYGSQYQITGGSVDEITYDPHSNSLIISLNESEKGYIQIVIQIGLLHSLDQIPFTYFVIADEDEVIFEQLSPIVLKIPFEKDTQKIEIIGTFW